MRVEVTTWYLEMLDPGQLRPATPGNYDLRVEQVQIPSPEFSRWLYTSVGGDWYWHDRLTWTADRWLNYLDRPQVQTWVSYISGTPAEQLLIQLFLSRTDRIYPLRLSIEIPNLSRMPITLPIASPSSLHHDEF